MKAKATAGLVFLFVIVLILGAKAVQLDWFNPKPALVLNSKPAILFFNNDRGCECALFVYRQADAQLSAWLEKSHPGIPIIPINLERRPDLAQEYKVIRGPSLLLLDSAGQIHWRQDEVITDEFPFDLKTLESQIELLKAGE